MTDRFQCPDCDQWYPAASTWSLARHRLTTWHSPVKMLRASWQDDRLATILAAFVGVMIGGALLLILVT